MDIKHFSLWTPIEKNNMTLMIYKTIENSPFFAVEVDGYKYHED